MDILVVGRDVFKKNSEKIRLSLQPYENTTGWPFLGAPSLNKRFYFLISYFLAYQEGTG